MFLAPLILQGCLTTKSSTPLREFQQEEYEYIATAENDLLNCYKSGYTDFRFTQSAIMSIKNNARREGYLNDSTYQNILNQIKNKKLKVDKDLCLELSIYAQENIDHDNAHRKNELINQQLMNQYEQERKMRYIQSMNQSIQNLTQTYINSITPKPSRMVNCYHSGAMTTCY